MLKNRFKINDVDYFNISEDEIEGAVEIVHFMNSHTDTTHIFYVEDIGDEYYCLAEFDMSDDDGEKYMSGDYWNDEISQELERVGELVEKVFDKQCFASEEICNAIYINKEVIL